MDLFSPGYASLGIAATGCAIAAVWDWRCRRIPNGLTYPLTLVALGMALALGEPGPWLGGALALLLVTPLVAVCGLGMGDAKLLLALGLLLGPLGLVWLFGLAVALGAVFGVCAWLWQAPGSGAAALISLRLPFAVPLSMAAIALPLLPPG